MGYPPQGAVIAGFSEYAGVLFETSNDSMHATSTKLDEVLNLTRTYASISCSAAETNLFIDDSPIRGTIGNSVKINLSNMQAGDTYVLKEYYRISSGGLYIQSSVDASNTYSDVQTPALKIITIRPYLYGYKITATKTAGIDRTIDYEAFVEN